MNRRQPGGFAALKRLSVHTAFAVALWTLPNLAAVLPGGAMKPHHEDLVRDAAIGVLLTAVAVWVSRTKGNRRPESEDEDRGGSD